jgi:type I restriction enzyme R subunit
MDRIYSNFDFLDRLDHEFAHFGMLSENYFQDDPSTSLIKLRQFGERLTRRHAALVGSDVWDGETQADVLRRLQYDRSAPDRVLDVLHHIRKLGNAAVHDGAGNHRVSCFTVSV